MLILAVEEMKSRWSIFFIYGLIMKNMELSNTSDVQNLCIETFKDYIHPTAEFLNMLSVVYKMTEGPFKIRFKAKDNVEFQQFGDCKIGDGRPCRFKRSLLRHFYAVVTATQLSEERTPALADQDEQNTIKDIEISLTVKSEDNKGPLTEEFCTHFIRSLSNSINPCTTSPSLPCETVCNTDKTTFAENHISSTARVIEQKEGLQVSDIVIASLVSFFGGVICSVFTFFMYRFKCHGKPKHESSDGNTVFDDVHLKTKVAAKSESKQETSQTTYETLTSTECATADNANTDHVYLGLDSDSKSNELSDVNNFGGNALQVNSVGSSEHLGCKQNNEVKDDHVYNVLKTEEAASVYEGTMAKDLTEHTYTGLTDREPENRRVKQERSEEVLESNNNRSSETHNYIILQDEVNGNTGDVSSNSNDFRGHETHETEMTRDNLSSTEHAYFTLHKIDQSDCPTAEIDQIDENIESENYAHGHAYHTLEKVEIEN